MRTSSTTRSPATDLAPARARRRRAGWLLAAALLVAGPAPADAEARGARARRARPALYLVVAADAAVPAAAAAATATPAVAPVPAAPGPAAADEHARVLERLSGLARRTLQRRLDATTEVTSAPEAARRHRLSRHTVDVSVTELRTSTVGSYVEIEARLRLAISDRRGKVLSLLDSGAKVQVHAQAYDPTLLPELRRNAVEGAIEGAVDKLLPHLRRGAGA